jgi:addiction module HigA family antidote
MARLANVHPGDVLLEDFLKPLELSQNALARAIGVSPRRINEICLRQRAVSADTAIRLSRYFGTSKEFWLGLQNGYDTEEAERKYNYNKIKRGKFPHIQEELR